MERKDLVNNIKEKLLFEGNTSTGKTFVAMLVAKIYLMNNKKVIFIDSEGGSSQDALRILNDLEDKQLANMTIVNATDIVSYLKAMRGYNEKKTIGAQTYEVPHFKECDLKICDGFTDTIDLYKFRLEKKYKVQGFYNIGETKFNIVDEETFVLPWQYYGKLYDQMIESLYDIIDSDYDILCTMHPLKETDTHRRLQQNIYAKFDTVIRFKKVLQPSGRPEWNSTLVKNRGKESINRSNTFKGAIPVVMYYINKFDMDIDETKKRLCIFDECNNKK